MLALVLGLFVAADGGIPEGHPFAGKPGVGPHGYPLHAPDQLAMRKLLAEKKYAELEGHMTFWSEAGEADFHKEMWARDCFEAFSIADSKLTPQLDGWVKTRPAHFAAWAARGAHRFALAWEARGAHSASNTTDQQFKSMGEYAEAGERDLRQALQRRPKLFAAHRYLLVTGRAVGKSAAWMKKELDAGLAVVPLSYTVRSAYIQSLIPRWGGSIDEMNAYAETLPVDKNPRLAALQGWPDFDACEVALTAKKITEARKACDRALAHGDAAIFLVKRGGMLIDEGMSSEALKLADRALDLEPHHPRALSLRARALYGLGRTGEAATAMVTALRLDPTDDKVAPQAASLGDAVVESAAASLSAGEAKEAVAKLELALELKPALAGLRSFTELETRARSSAAR